MFSAAVLDGPGPIEGATARLTDWLGTVVDAPIRTETIHTGTIHTGTGEPAEPALCAQPIELVAETEVRRVGPRPPLRFRVRHLVTAAGPAPAAARLLDRVLVAAVDAGDPEVRIAPVAPDLWRALGVPPRPALLFDVPAQVNRAVPEPTLVRRPLRIDELPVRPLRGTVLGPDDVPLAGLRVEVAATGAYATTNGRGEFGFGSVPAQDRTTLRLIGKGRRIVTEVDSGAEDVPLIIRFELEEV